MRRPDDAQARPLNELLDEPCRGDRHRDRPRAAGGGEQMDEQEQRAIDGHLLTQLVDEEQALGAAIEDDAEIGSDGRDELPGSIHRGLRARRRP